MLIHGSAGMCVSSHGAFALSTAPRNPASLSLFRPMSRRISAGGIGASSSSRTPSGRLACRVAGNPGACGALLTGKDPAAGSQPDGSITLNGPVVLEGQAAPPQMSRLGFVASGLAPAIASQSSGQMQRFAGRNVPFMSTALSRAGQIPEVFVIVQPRTSTVRSIQAETTEESALADVVRSSNCM